MCALYRVGRVVMRVCVCPVQSGEGGDEGVCVPCAGWGGW